MKFTYCLALLLTAILGSEIKLFADQLFPFQDATGLVFVQPDGISTLSSHEFAESTAVEGFTDGIILRIQTKQGDGLRVLASPLSIGEGKVFVEVSIRVSGPGAMIALAALDQQAGSGYETLNGSGSFLIEMDSSLLKPGWQTFSTLYDPAREGVVPLLQIVGTGPTSATVEIDNLRVLSLKQAYEQGADLARLLGVATPPPAPTPTPTPPPIGSPEAQQVLGRINQIRIAAGLSPLQLDSALLKSAQSHAEYMAQNNILDHAQDITKPGFTGARAWDRATAAGYPNTNIWEDLGSVDALFSDPVQNVNMQLEGPFHRIPMLHAGLQHLGYGAAASNGVEYHSLNFGSYAWDPIAPVYYPGENHTDVPLAFGGYEYPDPFPGSFYPIGYPITLFAPQDSDFKVVSYSLKEINGPSLPVTVLLPGDKRGTFDTSFVFAMASTTPLKADTLHEASIEAVINGQSTLKTWRFRTQKESAPSGKRNSRGLPQHPPVPVWFP